MQGKPVRVFRGCLITFSDPPWTIYNHLDLTPAKNFQFRSAVLSYYPVTSKQARSLCKSKNRSIFQTDPILFANRIQFCTKYGAHFCECVGIRPLRMVLSKNYLRLAINCWIFEIGLNDYPLDRFQTLQRYSFSKYFDWNLRRKQVRR